MRNPLRPPVDTDQYAPTSSAPIAEGGASHAVRTARGAPPVREEPAPQSALDILKVLESRFTEYTAVLRGLSLNDVLETRSLVFDANGMATLDHLSVPFAALAVMNLGNTQIIVSNDPPQVNAPNAGPGVQRVPALTMRVLNLTGHQVSIYGGQVGAFVDIVAFTRPQQASASQVNSPTTGATAVVGTGSPGDALANPTDALDTTAFLEIWNGATWTRLLAKTPADATPTAPNAIPVDSWLQLFNGTTNDRARDFSGLADLLGTLQAMPPSSTPGAAAPAANTAAVVTFGAVAGQQHRLTYLSYSTSGTPAAATTVTVSDGTTTFTFDVAAVANNSPNSGVQNIPLPDGGIKFAAGAALTITLGALGAGISGRVNAGKVTG